MQQKCLEKWNSNLFWELVDPPKVTISSYLNWVEYEEYMKAILLDCVPGELGRLLVDFPANSTEDNRLRLFISSPNHIAEKSPTVNSRINIVVSK